MPLDIKSRIGRQPLWLKLTVIALVAAGCLYLAFGHKHTVNKTVTFTARRGPLEINVLQGGSVESLESQAIKCEVRGYQGVKILKIVEEGYQVTADDVKTNKVLVELDSSEIQKQITQEDINFESTWAALTDARQAYDIQVNQNFSDVNAAVQKAKFARMDFDKAMGGDTSSEIIASIGLNQDLTGSNATAIATSLPEAPKTPPQDAATPAPSQASDETAPSEDKPLIKVSLSKVADSPADKLATPVAATAARSDADASASDQDSASGSFVPPKPINVEFDKFANLDSLGDGDMKQKMRKNEDDLQVAQKELSQAQTQLEGTRRLFDKGFVTKTELDADEFKYENARLKVQTAETTRNLFLRYEFPKTSEETLSKYVEAVRELDRTRKSAVAKLAQAEAKRKSAEGRYNLEVRQRKDLRAQLEKCSIMAKRTGLVVYGGGNMNAFYYGGEEQIREGALVREQQPIITIPDMTKMAVKVRINETYIKQIKKGLKVRITVEAFPDKVLTGEITKVGVLPDSQNMWMNPDMKVYLTTISIDEVQDWLKPGMSAKAEILVDRLSDVVYVPIQAISAEGAKQVCYVINGNHQEPREVQVGGFNDEFIEVKSGLKEGEHVCLRAPDSTGGEKKPESPAPPAAPKPGQVAAAEKTTS